MSGFSVEVLGEWPVYPGHPLTTAAVIMHRYGTLAEAEAPTEHGWPAVLGGGDVDGAGGEVYSALRLLQDIRDGRLLAEDAPEEAARRWKSNNAGGLTDRVVPGQEQADRVRELFLAKARAWFASPPAMLPAAASAAR